MSRFASQMSLAQDVIHCVLSTDELVILSFPEADPEFTFDSVAFLL